MAVLGLVKSDPTLGVNSIITVLLYVIMVGSLVINYFKNKYIFFTGILTVAFLIISFIVLQIKWDQSRLIIPAVPLLLLVVLSAFYYLSEFKNLKILQFIVPLFALLIFFKSLGVSAEAIKTNREVSGIYGGLTPDWKNYLKASEWAADNLPKDAMIACRKPSISFVYGKGREFYGIMQLPNYSFDIFYKNWLTDEKSVMLFNYADFKGKQLTPQVVQTLKQNMMAMVFVGDTVYFADKISDSLRPSFTTGLQAAGLRYLSTVSEFKSTIPEGKVMKLYYPDSLLTQLQNAGVTHILTANLRRNSTVKDGMIINTVERFMAFIQEKYQQIFTKVSQAGEDDNEPASILKIEYEKYGRSIKKPVAKK